MRSDNSIAAPDEKNPGKNNAFPPWLRRSWPRSGAVDEVRGVLDRLSLNTVCRGAQCPNQGECWSRGTATFMILGNVCSRNCAFCGVSTGSPVPPDNEEPRRLAEAVKRLKLKHCVVTSVTRDDLPDGGASHFAAVIGAIRNSCPGVSIEILTPDFAGNADAITTVTQAAPDVFGHNVETVARLHSLLRDARASYARSLEVLRMARERLAQNARVKSGLMVGCGETEQEVFETLADLRAAGCDAVTVGQYLKPRTGRAKVVEYITPEQFARYEKQAFELGFRSAMAGPFVRSSYHADALIG
jgi:lipoyl synthase